MIICGIKLTHDGAVALIENGKLIFNIELEKLQNNPRFQEIKDTTIIEEILTENGYDVSSVDYFAVDGWGGDDQDALAIQPRLEIGEMYNKISAYNNNIEYKVNVGRYEETTMSSDVLEEWNFKGLKLGNKEVDYFSYLHAATHIMSAYCTSDFAQNEESSYILIWDGGMYPRLYYYDVNTNTIENMGPIFLMIGNIYTIFSQHFGPFKVNGSFAKDSLSIAGKVMAYIALGEVKRELFEYFDTIYKKCYDFPMGFANIFANEFKKSIEDKKYCDEDILCSFHKYLEEMLVKKLEKKIRKHNNKVNNLCFAGGCALNIKWNSAIRNSGIFNNVYVSPFPNDSGSAIGAACCAMFKKMKRTKLDWSVYSGPKIINDNVLEGWRSNKCSIEELSKLLYETGEPVVFLNGRAELGPRALGNRSILAAPGSAKTKDILNMIKKREGYRPVSPICLEHKAKEIFEPGIKDPYMLFDHMVKENWKEKIPAVLHLDGSARLQTVSYEQNHIIFNLLTEFEKISGIPLLCNTSANYNGRGFFPDIYSAMNWNEANYVWCDNILYEKIDKKKFDI